MTTAELARRTGTHERNVREWLAAEAAAGYVGYDRVEDSIYLNAEQATVFADQDSPAFMAGAFEAVTAFWLDADFLKSRLGKHEMISEMEIRAALPRTPVGKLSKKESYDEINAKAAAAKAAP